MELRHLKYFLTLSEELHFGKAAEKLFISQPPLSRQIKDLEEELGVPLFKRTKRHVQLTTYGSYFRDETQKLFNHIDLMKHHLEQLKKGSIGQIKIAYVGAVMHSIMPKVLVRLQQNFPKINATLLEAGNEDQIEGLRSGRLDIGFVRMPMTLEDLEIMPVYSETFSIILSGTHRMAGKGILRLKDLAEEPFISFCRSCAPDMVDMIVGMCNRAGFSPQIIHDTSQINSIVRLVESGLGFSIVPTSVKNGYNMDLVFFELEDLPERAELSMAYNPKNTMPLIKDIVEMVEGMEF